MACKFTINIGGKQQSFDANGMKKAIVDGLVDEYLKPTSETAEKPSGKEKSLLTRAHKGKTEAEVKAAIEKHGLTYEEEHHTDAKRMAEDFIEEVGDETAIEAIRKGQLEGAPAAMVFAKVIDNVGNDMAKAISESNQEEYGRLVKMQADLLAEFDRKARLGGQFTSALYYVYQNSELGYDLKRHEKEYREKSGGEYPEEVKKKFEALNEEMKELRQKVKEAEEKLQKAEEQRAIENIRGENARRNKQKESKAQEYKKKAKTVGDAIRKFQAQPMIFTDSEGNPIDINTHGTTWNDFIEKLAKAAEAAIEKTGEVADGIASVMKVLDEQEWYQKLKGKDKAAVSNQIKEKLFPSETTTKNKVKISHSMIRDLVEQGYTDINSLVEAVKEQIKKDYPNATNREIRDAITNYGKTIEPNPEPIESDIRKLKRIGRIYSALEDIAQKKRPLKSGQQRDKLEVDERNLLKELRDALKTLPTDTEAQANQLKTALDAAKQRVKNRIEELKQENESGVKKVRDTKGVEADAELIRLREERDALKEINDALFGKPELTEEQREDIAFKRIEKIIEGLDEQIANNDIAIKKSKPIDTPKLREARERLMERRKKMRELREEAGMIQQQRLDQAKKRTQKRIEELSKRLYEGDFSKKKKVPLQEDLELKVLKAKQMRIYEEYEKAKYKAELHNRTKYEKFRDDVLLEGWNLLRALRATGEASFVLLQGGVQSIAHPLTAIKAFKEAARHFASEEHAKKWQSRLKVQDFYPTLKASKLGITETDHRNDVREEQFLTGWTNLIWDMIGFPVKVFGNKAHDMWKAANPFKAVERAATGYLNTLRVQRFLDGMEMLEMQGKTFDENPDSYKNMADVINTLTGRASLGPAERFAKPLSMIFFSPRNWASVIKQATPYGLVYLAKKADKGTNMLKQPSVAQKMFLADYMKYVGLTTAMVMLVKAAFDDDDEVEVVTDPKSSDFMKIKMGNVRVDPWGGRQQQVVFMARVMHDVLEREGKSLGLAGKMARNKLAPSSALLYNFLTSKENKEGEIVSEYGKPYDFESELGSNIYPIYFDTFKEIMKEQPNTVGAFLNFYAFFGGGIQAYQNKPSEKQLTPEQKEAKEVSEKALKDNAEQIKAAQEQAKQVKKEMGIR